MHMQFVEGRLPDIIKTWVGDYILEETGETIHINMTTRTPSRNLNYTKEVRYDNEVELNKATRSELRLVQ